MSIRSAMTAALAGALFLEAASAQEAPLAGSAPGTDLSVRLGIGGIMQPEWEGSDSYNVVPWPIVSLEYLRLPGIGEFGGQRLGFSIGPSFNVVSKRDQFDDPVLVGLGDVDAAVELGLKGAYEMEHWGALLAVRRGFGGHDGIVGEAVAYGILRPTDRLELRGGPEITFADSEYFDTYFSVTPAQALLSGLPVYDAGSGFKSVGITGQATYSLTDKVDLHARASYTYLLSDAGESPIIEIGGSRNQVTVGAGISYRIDLDLFD